MARDLTQPRTINSLAAQGAIPAPYLAKLLQILSKSRLVKSRRGVNGGFELARSPEEITIADVVNAVEPMQRIVKCPLGLTAHEDLCPLHRKLDQALAMVEQAFRETTLSSLCRDGASQPPMCRLPLPTSAACSGVS